MTKDSPTLFVTMERLYHFKCMMCSKWWSVGDAEIDVERWFCPSCGFIHTRIKMNEDIRRDA